MKEYFKEELEERDTDPLQYWRRKMETYPTLARMAKQYLAVPASSTPGESLLERKASHQPCPEPLVIKKKFKSFYV